MNSYSATEKLFQISRYYCFNGKTIDAEASCLRGCPRRRIWMKAKKNSRVAYDDGLVWRRSKSACL